MIDVPPPPSAHERELLGMVAAELVLLFLTTIGMVWYFRAPLVPVFVSCVVVFAWYMGLSGTLLLPADIADAQIHGTSSAWLGFAWYTVYWSTFVLAWLVMPIMNGAWAAGELTWRNRVKQAIFANMLTWVLMALGGVAAVAIVLARGMADKDTLSGFLMAWGNTYGLMLIVLLMGHGLVEVPRQLWITSFPKRQLELLYFRATQYDTALYDAIYDMEDAEKDFERLQRSAGAASADASREQARMNLYLEAIAQTRDKFDLAGIAEMRSRPAGVLSPGAGGKKEGKKKKLTPVGELVALHSRLRRGQERVVAARQRWDDLMKKVEVAELVVSGQLPRPQSATAGRGSNPFARFATFLSLKWSRLVWLWRLRLRRHVLRVVSLVCWALTFMVLWSEVVLAAPTNLSAFGRILEAFEGRNPLLIQIGALVPFFYMSVCTYRSLFKLKLFGRFTLAGPHQSLPGPLMFNAQYLVRLQFPLGYNFLMMLHYNGDKMKNIAFSKLMSNMAVVPLLGTDFNVYAPLVMVVLCLFTLCHGYARLLRFVGIEHEDLHCADDSEGRERLEEGKSLVERGKRQAAQRDARRLATSPATPSTGYSSSFAGASSQSSKALRSYGRVLDEV